MAEETLKLPKPLLGNEIRNDFLTFPPERRWDLLGFIKSDDVEEIKSCEIGPDGHRYYLVRWKESWKPETSLVYCEKLLQDFWSNRSIIQGNDVQPSGVRSSQQTTVESESGKAIPDSTMLLEVKGNHGEIDKLTDTVTTIDPSIVISSHQGVNNEKPKEVPPIFIEEKILLSENTSRDIDFVADINPPLAIVSCHLTVESLAKESMASLSNEIDNGNAVKESEEKIEMNLFEKSIPDEEGVFDEQVDEDLSTKDELPASPSPSNELDSPSKKGAPKRKARPPQQSMNNLGPKNALAKKKEKLKKAKVKKLKEKAKGAKRVSARKKSAEKSSIIVKVYEHGVAIDESVSSSVNNLKCMVCDKFLASQQSLMKHLLTHNNNHTCPICQKTFKSTHFLKHHMDIHNASYQYSCPICGKKFKFQNNMRGHIKKHNMEKRFECEVCQKKFIGRYNLKEHMKSHSDVRPYACDFCTKSYKDRGALNKHLLTHQEKRVECEICKRPFTNMKQVTRHMQFHYSWPGESYKRKTNLGPDGEKVKFKCPHCDKVFNHYSNMNAHVHKKHKEKKIQCTSCPKTFAYQYELREHMFIHLGGTGSKFKCQYCNKSFQRSTTLKNHEKTTHLGIKRFQCEFCGKLFGTKFNMKVHVEKLHSDNPSKKSRGSKASQNDQLPTNEDVLLETFAPTDVNTGLPVSLSTVEHNSLLRSINTSDIIRNAMAHIPELNYFPTFSGPPRYQFYGMTMTQTDFPVSEPAIV